VTAPLVAMTIATATTTTTETILRRERRVVVFVATAVGVVANSLVWGVMCCLALLFFRKMREIPNPGPGRS